MKYQIWTNKNKFKIRAKNWFGQWVDLRRDGATTEIVYFDSIAQTKEFIKAREEQIEENNPRWKMVEEC